VKARPLCAGVSVTAMLRLFTGEVDLSMTGATDALPHASRHNVCRLWNGGSDRKTESGAAAQRAFRSTVA
jgi:hypothetical protein